MKTQKIATSSGHSVPKSGFTLIELLVVISIIGILLGVSLSAVQMARETSRRITCANNLKQINLAVQNFEGAAGRFPQGIRPFSDARPYSNWLIEILPYIEQKASYEQSIADYRATPNPLNHRGVSLLIPAYQCPSDPNAGVFGTGQDSSLVTNSYLGCNGSNYTKHDGVLFQSSKVLPASISDGLSNTILAGERPFDLTYGYGRWYGGVGMLGSGAADIHIGVRELNPLNGTYNDCGNGPFVFQEGNSYDPCHFLHYWSYHPGGAHFAFCDGSVRFFGYESDDALQALATRAGHEVASK